MEDYRKEQDTPSMDDSLKLNESHSNPVSESPAGKLLRNFVSTMNAYGEDAQETYDRALEMMRKHAEEVVIEIAQAYGHCHKNDYPYRWALVHAAAELRHPATLSFLVNLVNTPIPPERSKDPHSFSTVAEETILRTTAVEGVEYLLEGKEIEKAHDMLFEFLKQPSLSIRRAAVQALINSESGKKDRKRIAEMLPKDQRFLLEIERKNVEDVPQIKDPESHLKESAKQRDEKQPAPRMRDESEDDSPKAY
jgi:hypothetical protein